MDEIEQFKLEKRKSIERMGADDQIRAKAHDWFVESCRYRYSYNFSWMGLPIIQYPQDMIAMQEIIWEIRPDCIVETGIAHGGSLIYYGSLLKLLGGERRVIGVDIDIRPYNRLEIEKHPVFDVLTMIEGSSVDPEVATLVHQAAEPYERVLVVLDSNHTHEHVASELGLYNDLVTAGSYLVVFDTVVEELPDDFFQDRPWGRGNNPLTAVIAFLESNDRFEIDKLLENKLQITVAPGGYLKCIKDSDESPSVG